ncbi:hypothetical protein GCM10007094_15400 [Pseudovibrio japonicus]|uniref:Uncharacterized protein n=1 Tax=Pseudovibrio japonicus TaxID=366534 RepID=A0ABQ3E6C1_9HYPH|nr:hypothetical protein GCM10007094_15400 [Pseudovibrio japonicus]
MPAGHSYKDQITGMSPGLIKEVPELFAAQSMNEGNGNLT